MINWTGFNFTNAPNVRYVFYYFIGIAIELEIVNSYDLILILTIKNNGSLTYPYTVLSDWLFVFVACFNKMGRLGW